MSVHLKLYRVDKSNTIEDIDDLESSVGSANDSCVDLYKVYCDIVMVLANNLLDQFSKENKPAQKIIFGNKQNIQIGWRQCVGFISYSEIIEINKWIKERKLGEIESFFKDYENLNPDVKQELSEMYTISKEEMFNGYIKHIVEFYKTAEKNENSVVVCVE